MVCARDDKHKNAYVDYFEDCGQRYSELLSTVEQGFNYLSLDAISREEWQHSIEFGPCSHSLGYSKLLLPDELSVLGYILMSYIAHYDRDAYTSAYLKWKESSLPALPRKGKGEEDMVINGLIAFIEDDINEHWWYYFSPGLE